MPLPESLRPGLDLLGPERAGPDLVGLVLGAPGLAGPDLDAAEGCDPDLPSALGEPAFGEPEREVPIGFRDVRRGVAFGNPSTLSPPHAMSVTIRRIACTLLRSLGVASVKATPLRPARPVRPVRWT